MEVNYVAKNDTIIQASKSDISKKRALECFAKNIPLPECVRMATDYELLMGLLMNTIDTNKLCALLDVDILTVKKHTYSDNPRVAGSVFVFYIALTDERLKPEWLVHWVAKNKILAIKMSE